MMESAWTEPGFCVPNQATYPFQWLWDSCFHSIIWATLGDERCLTELENVFAKQTKAGFVPHVTYWAKPAHHGAFWGQGGSSTITQPPMYGHAVANLVRAGIDVPDKLLHQCRLGLSYLLRVRQRAEDGLVPVFHPWETGCDDSARWDDWRIGPDKSDWFEVKGALVDALKVEDGAAIGSRRFNVTSAGFNALLAWNVEELASIGAASDLEADAREVVQALTQRWRPDLRTWTDNGYKAQDRPPANVRPELFDGPDRLSDFEWPRSDQANGARGRQLQGWASGEVRTLDALLPLLVDPRPDAFGELSAGGGLCADFGPRGVHEDEPTYDPDVYWRGPAWPQLTYLMGLAARKAGYNQLAADLSLALQGGAAKSGLSEYWNPETGTGQGARPQGWSGLAIVDL